MGCYLVPGVERHHSADGRLARQPLRPPPDSADLRSGFYPDLATLRGGHQPRMAHLLPHPARPHRWWTATAGASRSAGDLPAQEAWHSDGGLWAWHYPRTYSRPYPRRLDHRQLHLALDLLPQPAGRHVFGADDQRLRTRPTLHREKQDRRSRLVGHRLPGTWIRDAATRTRHGPAQR